ncbi:hypothetical protein [Anabaena subtropica]|nr:hypothetical protein [Anabaena subtropica]
MISSYYSKQILSSSDDFRLVKDHSHRETTVASFQLRDLTH